MRNSTIRHIIGITVLVMMAAVLAGCPRVTVPDVVGMTQSPAESAIISAGLTVGTLTEQYSDTVPAGQVIGQSPAAGTSVAPDSAVALTVSRGPEPVTLPDVVGMTQSAAESAIISAGLTVGTVTAQFSGSVAAGRVVAQTPFSGANVLVGSPIDLVVSKGTVVFQPLSQYSFPIDSGDERYYTTIQSDAGKFGDGPSYAIAQENGALHIVTRTVSGASSYGGFWHSTNEKSVNTDLVLDPAAPLPWPIKEVYQPRIVGMYAVAKGHGDWRVELKQKAPNGDETEVGRHAFTGFSASQYTEYQWDIDADMPPFKLVNVMAETDSNIWLDEIGFLLEMPESVSPLRYAFLTSLGQMLRCYDHETGYVRDHSNWPVQEETPNPALEDSRSFNTVPGEGFAALTAACAADLGFIATADAEAIVRQTTANLLSAPSHASGFLCHWSRLHTDGSVDAHPNSEYSTVDTALAYLCSYTAAAMLGLETERSAVLNAVRALDFDAVSIDGRISHGFSPEGQLLESVWNDFGGETTLLMVLAKLNDLCKSYECEHEPPVFRGNGFIAELASLVFPHFGGNPVYGEDAYGVDWYALRQDLLAAQKAVLNAPRFVGGHSSCEIISAEGHHAYLVSGTVTGEIEAFPSEDGTDDDFGTLSRWVAPHYRLMTSGLEPADAAGDVDALCDLGLMQPLCGPAESVLWNLPDWSVARWHSKQVAINAFFSVMGAYHGIVTDEGIEDAVYRAVTDDSDLDPAAEAVFGDEGGLPGSLTLQGENGKALAGSSPDVMPRGNADEQHTMLLQSGEGIGFDVSVPCPATCTAVVRYSNDNYGPPERVEVVFVNTTGDSQVAVGTFDAQDTGDYGTGWNVFVEADGLGPVMVAAGTYELRVVCVADTGDGYGVEIDSIHIEFGK